MQDNNEWFTLVYAIKNQDPEHNEREMPSPSLCSFLHTKVAPPSHQFSYLSSLFPNCIQDDITSQRFSPSVGLKKQTYTTNTVFFRGANRLELDNFCGQYFE